ncbi:hypothetical protein Q766_07515 [Flavobacterium subsaxonicum WB 4.1-42 = DSM 21790]|uniref:Uncharacterized protein n=1 Tax=Flavobacterium subsaxonicum WB 4.1-42 = DSM 21790 TaxID=1121898 RepID=A0A0A2MQD8_9FLAO|nr:hypothetical protein Q766_07515 [Flavobacterium subsaxonicum WB 4.1-42 = DSM 21790]
MYFFILDCIMVLNYFGLDRMNSRGNYYHPRGFGCVYQLRTLQRCIGWINLPLMFINKCLGIDFFKIGSKLININEFGKELE